MQDDFLLQLCLGTSQLPSDGDLRLKGAMDSDSNSHGLLEIRINDKWRSMCGSLFSEEAASVACRQLGYRVASNYCTDAW